MTRSTEGSHRLTAKELGNAMTPQSLDERIFDVSDHGHYAKEVKQLIRDCIEAVTPPYIPEESLKESNLRHETYIFALGRADVGERLKRNTKELLG